MQIPRRLKLTVVLLIAAGLIGGVALWHDKTRLNQDEVRLVGRWKTIDSNLRFTPGSASLPLFDMELNANRQVVRKKGDPWTAFRQHWKVDDDTLLILFSSKRKTPEFFDPVVDLIERLPFTSRLVTRQFKTQVSYQIRWNGDDEMTLEEKGRQLRYGQHLITMRRVSAEK